MRSTQSFIFHATSLSKGHLGLGLGLTARYSAVGLEVT